MSAEKAASLKRTIKVLKFLLTLEDVELIKSTIEQIIDSLEEDARSR
jgi:hypothetical protein